MGIGIKLWRRKAQCRTHRKIKCHFCFGYFFPQERKHLSVSRRWLEGLVTWNSLRSIMDPTL